MTVKVVSVFSDITGKDTVRSINAALEESGASILDCVEFTKIPEKGREDSTKKYIFVGSGGTENRIASLIELTAWADPIVLLSHKGNNSLPAAMEVRSFLQSQGRKSRIVHGTVNQIAALLKSYVKFANVVGVIEDSRLGIVGSPSEWLISSKIDVDQVKERWGLSIIEIPMQKLLDGIKAVSDVGSAHLEKLAESDSKKGVGPGDITDAGRVTSALLELVQKYRLSAVTVECFKLLEETNVTGCHALSSINDTEGIVAGCEGDIPSTFTLLVAKLLTGIPGFMANVSSVNQTTNSVVFTHCTTPLSILESYDVLTHFESGLSVAFRGRFEHDVVTVIKIHGNALSDCVVISGRIIDNLKNESACRTQILVELDKDVSYFLEDSLANHHVVVLGDYVDEFQQFFDFMGLDGITVS